MALSLRSVQHDDDPVSVWGRAGWALFAAAAIGLIVYMASVGLAKASLIATVAGLFVGAAGLVLELAAPHSAVSPAPRAVQKAHNTHAGGSVVQAAHGSRE